jgi:hypothetical protein
MYPLAFSKARTSVSDCQADRVDLGPSIPSIRYPVCRRSREGAVTESQLFDIQAGRGGEQWSAALPNEEMQLTERGSLAGAPAADDRCWPAIFIKSRSAADLRCYADAMTLKGSGDD